MELIPTGLGRTPDFRINRGIVELKTMSGVVDTSSDGISKAMASRTMDARGQSSNVILDVSGQDGVTRQSKGSDSMPVS